MYIVYLVIDNRSVQVKIDVHFNNMHDGQGFVYNNNTYHIDKIDHNLRLVRIIKD